MKMSSLFVQTLREYPSDAEVISHKLLVRAGYIKKLTDKDDRILDMEEKPCNPKSNWCCPPFYYYTRSDARQVSGGIRSGCGVDAPGSYMSWLCSQVPVHAMEMPGRRYDIGNLESYSGVCETYKGYSE